MRKHNKFERTSKGVVFACETCGRNTRMAGQGNDALCLECWDLAGLDNHVNDGGDLASVAKERDALLRKAVARGGDEAAIKASNSFLFKPRVGFHTGLTGDDVDVPDFLLVGNRKPLTAKLQAKLDTQTVKQQPERVDGRKPKGMSWEDWDAYLQSSTAKAAVTSNGDALPAPRGTSTRKQAGMLDANYFAPLCGCEPKVVRRALRSQPKPFAVAKPAGGWVFTKDDEAKVIAVVKAYLQGKGKKQPVASKSADPKVDATLRAAFAKPKAGSPGPKLLQELVNKKAKRARK